MPFSPPFPRSFTTLEVRTRVPSLPGVYGISNASEWIYIGESANLQATLLDLLQRPQAAFAGRPPTGFVFEVCDSAQRPGRHNSLIHEYRPTHNNAYLDPRFP